MQGLCGQIHKQLPTSALHAAQPVSTRVRKLERIEKPYLAVGTSPFGF